MGEPWRLDVALVTPLSVARQVVVVATLVVGCVVETMSTATVSIGGMIAELLSLSLEYSMDSVVLVHKIYQYNF